ncbi:MAG TPA: ATP-binding protein [Gaiellales bacterium]|jgi:serine/threonine-protein kinase RsbW|nr:ATP-binding protein [Gaiellales bacterium]
MSPVGAPHHVAASEYASEVGSLPLVREQLDALLDGTPVEREKRWDIRLAVTEACSNVVRHAYPETPGEFQVAAELTPATLEVTVRDAGGGSTARIAPRVGMLLVHEASDAVSIEDGHPGLIVRMSFNLR